MRTLAERAQDWRWWGEQGLHMALGALIGLTAAWGPVGPLTASCAALIVALAREWEQRPVASWGDLAVDVVATVAGGALVGGLVYALA